MEQARINASEPGSALTHRILDDLAEIIAECELLLPTITPVYSMSKRIRNIRRLADRLAQDIVRRQSRPEGAAMDPRG